MFHQQLETQVSAQEREQSVQPFSESLVLGLRPAAGGVKKMPGLRDKYGEEA